MAIPPQPNLRIDAHQHFWRYNAARDTWITDEMSVLKRDFLPQDLAPELAASGLDASIAVQADQSEAETMFLLELANASEGVAGVVGWVDLRSPGIAERLEHFSRFSKLLGFRHIAQSELEDHFLVGHDFVRGLSQLRQFGLTYDILIYARQLPAAMELVSRLPEQKFVIDHLAKPEIKANRTEPWARQMRQLAQSNNVFCKVSGLVTEGDSRQWKPQDFKPYLYVVFEAFGTGRLMFGSDWPVCLLAASYPQVVKIISDYTASFSEAEKSKIFGGNAIRFYGLKAAQYGFAA
jgi:L-fucono-1,5-lactonase